MRGVLLDLLEAFSPVLFMFTLVGLLHCAERHTVIVPPSQATRIVRVTYWVGAYATAEELKQLVVEGMTRGPCFAFGSAWTQDGRLPGCVYPLCDSLHCHPPMILKDLTEVP
jgi:hypothetical protein